jgi:hypothetical protein
VSYLDPFCPALDRQAHRCPHHQHERKANRKICNEHGIEGVVLEGLHRVFVTQHQHGTTCHEAETRDNLRWWMLRVSRGRRPQIQDNVRQNPGDGKPHEEPIPLRVEHRRDFRRLVMPTHDRAQEVDNDSWDWVHDRPAPVVTLKPCMSLHELKRFRRFDEHTELPYRQPRTRTDMKSY